MYLHLGLDMMIDAREIIGIFDIKNFKKDFIKEKYSIIGEYKDTCSSFILADGAVYFSEISPFTLKKRYDNMFLDEII